MSMPRHTAAVGCRWLFVQCTYIGKRQQRYNHGGEEWPSFIVATTMHRHMSRLSLHRARPTETRDEEEKREEKKKKKKTGSRRSMRWLTLIMRSFPPTMAARLRETCFLRWIALRNRNTSQRQATKRRQANAVQWMHYFTKQYISHSYERWARTTCE